MEERLKSRLETEPERESKRVIMSRVLRDGQEDDGKFDREFWRKVGAEGRFSAAWEMVEEYERIRGGDGRQPRLQRTVTRLLRSGS